MWDIMHDLRGQLAQVQRGIRTCLVLLVAVYAALFLLGDWGGTLLAQALGREQGAAAGFVDHHMAWVGLIAYTLLLAIAFVPDAEIALTLLIAFGNEFALQIYVATVVGLSASYLVASGVCWTAIRLPDCANARRHSQVTPACQGWAPAP